MICPHCGAHLEREDAKFCANCGKALDTSAPGAAPASETPPEPKPQPQPGPAPQPEPAPQPQSVPQQSSSATPVPASRSGVKEGVNPAILIGIVAAAVVVIVAALVFVLFSWNDSDVTEPATTPSEQTTVSLIDNKTEDKTDNKTEDKTENKTDSTTDDKTDSTTTGTDRFVGQWRLESATIYGYDAKTVYTNQQRGKYVMLTLNEDGTGTLDKMGEVVDVTWKMKDDKVGLYEGDGYSFEMRTTSNDGLVIRNNNDQRMVFRKA